MSTIPLRATPARSIITRGAPLVAALGLLAAAAPAAAQQEAELLHACYVPASGTVSRIKLPGLATACLSAAHAAFSWSERGTPGETGPAGPAGQPGEPGATGAAGAVGPAGPQGIQGDPGPAGADGAQGAQGPPGADGADGAQGIQGAAGADGADGAQGIQGPQGDPGPAGTSDHSLLLNLTADDHAQYLLTNGVRNTTNGFAVTGALNAGSIPVEGAGPRMMWFPGRAAFRAGRVVGTAWNLSQIGEASVAFGTETTASGHSAVAMGFETFASGTSSAAIGSFVEASGDFSTAMGTGASTNGHRGSFAYADFEFPLIAVANTAPNQFLVRARGGFRFRTSADLDTGCDIAAGNLTCTGTITGSSDVALKEAFQPMDAEDVLTRLATIPIQTWRYRVDDAGVRHAGPSAQDFRAAFGLGQDDKTISMVDADGINMLAIQALERRTRELDERTRELNALEQRVRELERLVASLAAAAPVPLPAAPPGGR